jgi:hypothetical protein
LPTTDLPAVFVVAAFPSWLIATPTINFRLTNRLSLLAIRCRFSRPADLPTADLPAVFVVAAVFRRG